MIYNDSVIIFLDHPLSLQSICRLAIRNELGPHRFCHIQKLSLDHAESGGVGLAPYLIDFLEYRQLFLSVQQLPESNSWNNASHTKAVKQASKVIREVLSPRIHQIIIYRIHYFFEKILKIDLSLHYVDP